MAMELIGEDQFQIVTTEQVDIPAISRPSTITEAECLRELYSTERIISSDYHAADMLSCLVTWCHCHS